MFTWMKNPPPGPLAADDNLDQLLREHAPSVEPLPAACAQEMFQQALTRSGKRRPAPWMGWRWVVAGVGAACCSLLFLPRLLPVTSNSPVGPEIAAARRPEPVPALPVLPKTPPAVRSTPRQAPQPARVAPRRRPTPRPAPARKRPSQQPRLPRLDPSPGYLLVSSSPVEREFELIVESGLDQNAPGLARVETALSDESGGRVVASFTLTEPNGEPEVSVRTVACDPTTEGEAP